MTSPGDRERLSDDEREAAIENFLERSGIDDRDDCAFVLHRLKASRARADRLAAALRRALPTVELCGEWVLVAEITAALATGDEQA